MHIIAVGILLVVSVIALLICAIAWACEGRGKNNQFFFGTMVAAACVILLVAWLVRANMTPLIISKTTLVTPTKLISTDGTYIQMITYTDQYGKRKVINLRYLFDGVVPENAKVKVFEYSPDGYAGINFSGIENTCPPRYAVVPEER